MHYEDDINTTQQVEINMPRGTAQWNAPDTELYDTGSSSDFFYFYNRINLHILQLNFKN